MSTCPVRTALSSVAPPHTRHRLIRPLSLLLSAAAAFASHACLTTPPPGTREYLYALIVDPQRVGEGLYPDGDQFTQFGECLDLGHPVPGCTVRVEIIDLVDNSKVGGFSLPAASTIGPDQSPTGYASSMVVTDDGKTVFIGERIEEAVWRTDLSGVITGVSPVVQGFNGPEDLVLSSDEAVLYAHDGEGISRIATATMVNTGRWIPNQNDFPSEWLDRNIALSPDGSALVATVSYSDEDAQGGSLPWVLVIDTATMSLVAAERVGHVVEGCAQGIDDLVVMPQGRLVLVDATCNVMYQYHLATKTDLTYLEGQHIAVGSNQLIGHLAHAPAPDEIYTSIRRPTLRQDPVILSPPTSTATITGWVGRVTDIASNVDGTSVYYSLGTFFEDWRSKRLAAVHTATRVRVDSVYHFLPTTYAGTPRVMEMQAVRRAFADTVLAPAPGDPPPVTPVPVTRSDTIATGPT